MKMKTALTIAGSDSSGGAGIQADIKTMTANGVFALCAVTALTAQNTTGVTDIFDSTPHFLAEQLDAVFTDIFPDAVKIGMVSSAELIETIAAKLKEYGAKHIVVDPVMVATSGAKLLRDDAVTALCERLLPLAEVLTPNIPEAEILSGMTIRAFREMTKKQLQVQIMRASKYDQEIPPTPEEIQQEYESTKEQYRDLTKDKIKFKKIFIPMLGDDSASTPEVQLNLAELIAKEIKSKNATFEEMAKRYSKDLYAEKGGDWPVTERSTLSPESAAIIFGAQPGEIIGPLVDSTGFTIVLVEKKELAPPPPLSAIKEQIDIMARNKRSNERYKKWVERLRKKAIVKIYI